MGLHVVEDPLEALVGGLLVLQLPELHRADLLEHHDVARNEVAHLDEGAHDAHACVNGHPASQNGGAATYQWPSHTHL